ncbi:protein N-lysine methyltransferase METTL21A [Sesamum alatum]|uniref:Protein N-lysine methyltransferase METTL21A n=1 Tax=Sesamum alatum TaxID=300844 RepID=A0AAE1Z1P5_9LAMI|nr:protein N-lysine methyltransferase METTL21A [Sesamum alatum]
MSDSIKTVKLDPSIDFEVLFPAKVQLFQMEADRLNSPHTSAVLFEALGHQLQFSQDPNSKHLGTTVWDASMVLVKFLEKNCRKGRFSPSKLKGKRVIELGAGCGVAGFGMALLGCDVISTDQTEVLPLLMRNVERNTSRILQTASDSDSFGSIQVAELNWGDEDHIRAVEPPFDYIIGTDVVYAEHLLEPLLQTILSLSGPRTTILLGYELRSTNVHDRMLDLWKRNFEVKSVPKAKMHSEYQHPSIQLYMMTLKPSDSRGNETGSHVEEVKSEETEQISDANEGSICVDDEVYDCKSDQTEEASGLVVNLQGKDLSDWEMRRYGAMAAQLLRDVKIT